MSRGRSSWWRGRLVLVGALAAALGGFAFACGSEDGGGSAPCEGAGCDEGGSEGSTPTEGGSDTSTTDGGGETGSDAGDAGDASDTGATCTGQPGTLDPTFGDGGIVVLSYGSETATASAVAIQPDGKIIVGGTKTNNGQGFAVVRLLSNGTLDPTFGTAGLVETKVGNTSHVLSAVALQPDGKILIAGYTRFVGQNFDFAVLRYSADGTLDTTFGTAGVVLTDFATRTDQAMAMVLMADGRILVSGQTLTDDLTIADMAFARYNADGSLDTTFGVGGRAMVDIRGTPDQARGVALVPGGKILAAGTSRDPAISRIDIAAVRLNADGSVDTTFGTAGLFVTNFGGPGSQTAQRVAIDATGKVVLAGLYGTTLPNDFGILRLTVAGTLDPSFGGTGVVTTDFGGRADDGLILLHQQDGKFVVAGTSLSGTPTDGRIAVARYLDDGGLDPNFGAGGKTLTPLPSGFFGANASGGVLGSCGFVVVGGWGDVATNLSRMGIVRYRR